MPKRFTDTEKWKDDWYLSLSNDYRIVWQYILDNCSHAGILKANFKMLNFCCNVDITPEKFEEVFKDRVVKFNSSYFIPKFIKFQYPKGLYSNKPAIISVRETLKENGLLDNNEQSLSNDYRTVKDKDMVKDKDKEKDNRAVSVLCYLNLKTGRNFRPTESTLKHICARIGEGFTKEQCLLVIDIKCNEWLGNKDFEKYLRPETLFNATKFQSYLNQNIETEQQKNLGWGRKA